MIKILGCELKREGTGKNGKPYRIFAVQVEGQKYPVDCFEDMTSFIGESVNGELVKKPYINKDGVEKFSYELKATKGDMPPGMVEVLSRLNDAMVRISKLEMEVRDLKAGSIVGKAKEMMGEPDDFPPSDIQSKDIPF